MRQNMVARRERLKQGHGRGCPAAESGRRGAAFNRANSVFESAPIWIVVARVHKTAPIASVYLALEGGGKMNGGRDRSSRRINRVTCVHCQGFNSHRIH